MNIYIGNLDFNTEESELMELFSKYGKVNSVHLIKDKFSGRGKGFGFVEMENKDEAMDAIEQINDTQLNDRKIIVNEAKPRN